jgi:hypothetical protein
MLIKKMNCDNIKFFSYRIPEQSSSEVHCSPAKVSTVVAGPEAEVVFLAAD